MIKAPSEPSQQLLSLQILEEQLRISPPKVPFHNTKKNGAGTQAEDQIVISYLNLLELEFKLAWSNFSYNLEGYERLLI